MMLMMQTRDYDDDYGNNDEDESSKESIIHKYSKIDDKYLLLGNEEVEMCSKKRCLGEEAICR